MKYHNQQEDEHEGIITIGIIIFLGLLIAVSLWQPDVEAIGKFIHSKLY